MREKNMNTKKGLFIVISFITYTVIYINYNRVLKLSFISYFKTIERDAIYIYKGTEDFLINTTGCYIPNYGKKITFIKIKNYHKTCEKRAVMINQNENKTITFKINENTMKEYSKSYDCCYSFATRSTKDGKEDTSLNYTKCTPFTDKSTVPLLEEVVTVTCHKKDKNKKTIYKDAYIVLNKIDVPKNNNTNENWNVLMVGMDTMSRVRLINSMKKTVRFLKDHEWLDYKGYTKIGPNTFPNLIAVLSGKKLQSIYKACSSGLDNCNDLIIWSKFRKAGYITAYGEDFLSLPDTFNRYNGFKAQPTHHYMRPLFLTGEQHLGSTICAGKKPSAKHILDYATDFANAYKKDKFFGLFWLNSYSHNLDENPSKFDSEMVNFFEDLKKPGIYDNTFVIFFSDHGIRFGDNRLSMESYFEERLPMLFLWIPLNFRIKFPDKYYNLQVNQNRLTTPYDLHATLDEILNDVNDSYDAETEACLECSSLFEEKFENRTCAQASIDEKWCSCHDLTEAGRDRVANESLHFAVSHIQMKAESVETHDCWKCAALKLHKLIRNHWYRDENNRTNYVVAFEMLPGNVSFEVTVLEDGNELSVVGPTDTISVYNTRGNCVKLPRMRPFCVCEKIKGCSAQKG